MFRVLSLFLLLSSTLFAKQLEEKIASMIVIGFEGEDINQSTSLYAYLHSGMLGGVILFDKNIKDAKQLKRLTTKLQSLSTQKLLITVDEEGGRVSRLGKLPTLTKTASAMRVATTGEAYAKTEYKQMAAMLKSVGINCNLAPSVDLAINPQNSVIVKSKRAFSKDPKVVEKYAEIFIKAHKKQGVLTVIKHFPGHGSSLNDSHVGFVDVSESWSEIELEPFSKLIQNVQAPMIMTAHIYNQYLDPKYPATLSYKINQKLLREVLGFKGVLMSDDLQMGAIAKNYSLEETLALTINSGVDLLLFANQIAQPLSVKQIVDCVVKLVKEGVVDIVHIERANARIAKLKRGL